MRVVAEANARSKAGSFSGIGVSLQTAMIEAWAQVISYPNRGDSS